MKDYYVDAVNTATSIHKGDFSFLHGKEFKVRDKMKKKKGRGRHVKKSGHKFTLADLVKKIDNLGNDLRNEMNAGFNELRQDIKDINARLDYIVEANNLKDLSNN